LLNVRGSPNIVKRICDREVVGIMAIRHRGLEPVLVIMLTDAHTLQKSLRNHTKFLRRFAESILTYQLPGLGNLWPS